MANKRHSKWSGVNFKQVRLIYISELASFYLLCSYRAIQLTSPNLNYFISIGALLMYGSVFLGSIHLTKRQNVVRIQCIVSYRPTTQVHPPCKYVVMQFV